MYCEPFCGGAAVFWAKQPSGVEIINDQNKELINFYAVLQTRFDELLHLIQATPHSRSLHYDAALIYQNPHLFDPIRRAWAVWMQTNQSFSSKICGGWAYARKENTCEKKTVNAKERLKEIYQHRLNLVQIECNDALQVIRSRDCEDAFFYCDPPYPETDQGHYSGYTMQHFRNLLDTLSGIKGKFILSSYPNDLLTEYTSANGWHKKSVQHEITARKNRSDRKMKTEVITSNFEL